MARGDERGRLLAEFETPHRIPRAFRALLYCLPTLLAFRVASMFAATVGFLINYALAYFLVALGPKLRVYERGLATESGYLYWGEINRVIRTEDGGVDVISTRNTNLYLAPKLLEGGAHALVAAAPPDHVVRSLNRERAA